MDRPTYGLVTHSMQRWEGATGLHQGWEGTPLLSMKRGAIDTRMARTGRAHVEIDEDLLKQAKRVGDPGRWDVLCDMVDLHIRDSDRRRAVFLARERRSRQVEGGPGWRDGRGCSLAELNAAKKDEWQLAQPACRARRTRVQLTRGSKIMIRKENGRDTMATVILTRKGKPCEGDTPGRLASVDDRYWAHLISTEDGNRWAVLAEEEWHWPPGGGPEVTRATPTVGRGTVAQSGTGVTKATTEDVCLTVCVSPTRDGRRCVRTE